MASLGKIRSQAAATTRASPAVKKRSGTFTVALLRLQPERLARQRVEQRAAQRAGGDGQKFAAFHASLPGFFRYLSISASAAQ